MRHRIFSRLPFAWFSGIVMLCMLVALAGYIWMDQDVHLFSTPKAPIHFSPYLDLNLATEVSTPLSNTYCSANTKSNLKMRTDNGEIYSDFEVQLRPSDTKPTIEDTRRQGGRYRLQIDKSMTGAINGGGPEFDFRTFNGNIYIRKAK